MNLDDYIKEKFHALYPDRKQLEADGIHMRLRESLFEAGAAHAEYFHCKEMFKVLELQIKKDTEISFLKSAVDKLVDALIQIENDTYGESSADIRDIALNAIKAYRGIK